MSSSFSKSQITCLLYGGAGFIGYHLSKLLLDQGCAVICVDNFSINRFVVAKELSSSPNFYFFDKNLEDISLTDFSTIDYVFSLIAAEIVINDIEGNYYKHIKTSFATQFLLELSLKTQSKFLLLNTAKLHQNYFQSQEDYQRHQVIKVSQDYAENLLRHYKTQKQLNARIVRTAYLFGPKSNLHAFSYPNYLTRNIFQRQKLVLPQDGLGVIYPTYVDDLVIGLAKAMFSQDTNGKIFNLINPCEITLLNLVYTIKDLYRLNFNLSFDSSINSSFLFLEKEDIDTHELLSWQARSSLISGLQKTISSFQEDNLITLLGEPTYQNLPQKNKARQSFERFFSQSQTARVLPVEPSYKQSSLASPNNHKDNVLDHSSKTILPTNLKPSVVTISFWQRLKLVLLAKFPKSNNRTTKKISKPAWIFKLAYLFIPACFFLLVYFFPRIMFKHYFSQLKKNQSKIEKQLSSSSSALKTISQSQGRYRQLHFYYQIISWQNHFLGKSLDSTTISYLEFSPLLNSFYLSLENINALYRQIQAIILGSDIQDISPIYQSLQNNLDQALQNLSSLSLQLKARNPQDAPIFNLEYYSHLESLSKLNSVLPTVLSFNQKSQTMILIQDNLELRPTGGFISAIAILTSEKGKIIDFNVYDIYSLDSQLKGKVIPPSEFSKYGFENNWFFRDLNFSPSFSCYQVDIQSGQHCTAGDAIWFAKQALGIEPNSVVAINLNTLSQILQITGPINLTNFSEIDSYNLFEKSKTHSQIDKNEFLLALLNGIFEKLKNIDSYSFSNLLSSLAISLEDSDTLIYHPKSPLQTKIEEYGWSGGLRTSPTKLAQFGEINVSDYLAIYESNFSYRKNNYYTQNSLSHNINIDEQGSIQVNSQFVIKNNAVTQTWPSGNYDKNYLRYLLPQETSLKSITLQLINGSVKKLSSDEVDRKFEGVYRSVGFLLSIPTQSQVLVSLNYELSKSLFSSQPNHGNYALYLQKQPGSYDSNYQLNFSLAPNLKLSKISPTPEIHNNQISFSGIFDRDKVFVLSIDCN